MAFAYSVATQAARMLAVRNYIDSGGAAGRLEICTAGYATVLATITLGYPGNSTATLTGTTMTLAGFPRSDTSADATGTAALARIRTSTGEDVITGLTVGTSDADVLLGNLVLTQGMNFTIGSAVFAHAAMTPTTYPLGVDPTSSAPVTDGSLTAFATAIGLSASPTNRWIDTNIKPDGAWAVRSMIQGAKDATRAEVEPTPSDVGNFTAPASDTLLNSNGAAWFPTKKQFFWWGGGHGGYPGSEVYWVDVPSMAWGRLTDPSPMERWPEGPSGWGWKNSDGTPVSSHTYDAIVAVESLDSFFVIPGSPWPDGDFPNLGLWKFHIPTKTWTLMQASPFGFDPFRGSCMHWIPEYQKIAIGQPNYWRWYDPFTNTLGNMLGSTSTMGNGTAFRTGTGICCSAPEGVYYVPFSSIGVSRPFPINATTHPRITSHARWNDAKYQWNSFLWDTTRQMVISWSAAYVSEPTTGRVDVGKQVYAIDFANDHLYEFVVTGGTWATSTALGSFTKWQHLVELDCYIGLNNAAETNGFMVFKPGAMTQLI